MRIYSIVQTNEISTLALTLIEIAIDPTLFVSV